MPHILVQTSIVILAESHNPSIVQPTFLKTEGIVPDSWGEPKEAIVTPPFASITYDHVQIVVEANRLQIRSALPHTIGAAEIAGAAQRYVKALPKTPYRAVGINFGGFSEQPDPGPAIVDRYVSEGPWKSEELQPTAAEVTLSYSLEGADLKIRISIAQVKLAGMTTTQTGVGFDGNFHLAMEQGAPMTSALKALESVNNRAQQYSKVVEKILGEDNA